MCCYRNQVCLRIFWCDRYFFLSHFYSNIVSCAKIKHKVKSCLEAWFRYDFSCLTETSIFKQRIISKQPAAQKLIMRKWRVKRKNKQKSTIFIQLGSATGIRVLSNFYQKPSKWSLGTKLFSHHKDRGCRKIDEIWIIFNCDAIWCNFFRLR